MPIYYTNCAASQAVADSNLPNSTRKRVEQKRPFCERSSAATPGTLGTSAAPLVYNSPHTRRSSAPQRRTPSVITADVVNTYKAKSGRAARKPIRSLTSDQKLSTAQLLNFRPLRSWKRLRPNERLALIAKTVLLSEAYAFTLNFDHAQIDRLREPGTDPVKLLSDKINRLLRKHFGRALELGFTFEFSANERLHVHGFAILPDHDPETVAKFKLILKQAGGVIHGAAAGYQVDAKPMRSDGWRDYLEKDAARTAELLGTDKIDYSSRGITQLAKAEHERELARLKAAKKRTAAKKSKDSEPAIEALGESSATSGQSDTAPVRDDSPRPSMAVSIDRQLADLIAGVGRDLSSLELEALKALDEPPD